MSKYVNHLAALALALLSTQPGASPVHLSPPTVYDNAEANYGQVFVAEEGALAGVRLYIGDPTRPGDPQVDALDGLAYLVLFDATAPAAPVEIARAQVQSSAQSSFGLTTFLFGTSIPTVVGQSYFVAIDTLDQFGLGLTNQFVSTYSGGFEGRLNAGGAIEQAGANGRDTSFEIVSTVAEPAGLTPLALLVFVVVARLNKRTP